MHPADLFSARPHTVVRVECNFIVAGTDRVSRHAEMAKFVVEYN